MHPPSPPLFLHDVLRHFIDVSEDMMERAEVEIDALQEQAMEVSQNDRTDMMRRMDLVRQELMVLQRRLLRKRLVVRDAITSRSAVFVAGDAHAILARSADELDDLARDVMGLKDDLNTAQNNYLSKISIDMASTAQVSAESVKVFAIATTLAIPVTGIGGILGMNVYFPSTQPAEDGGRGPTAVHAR